jgi:hypothetical protein
MSSDPIFKREFTKALITGGGALLGVTIMALILKKMGVFKDSQEPPVPI